MVHWCYGLVIRPVAGRALPSIRSHRHRLAARMAAGVNVPSGAKRLKAILESLQRRRAFLTPAARPLTSRCERIEGAGGCYAARIISIVIPRLAPRGTCSAVRCRMLVQYRTRTMQRGSRCPRASRYFDQSVVCLLAGCTYISHVRGPGGNSRAPFQGDTSLKASIAGHASMGTCRAVISKNPAHELRLAADLACI